MFQSQCIKQDRRVNYVNFCSYDVGYSLTPGLSRNNRVKESSLDACLEQVCCKHSATSRVEPNQPLSRDPSFILCRNFLIFKQHLTDNVF